MFFNVDYEQRTDWNRLREYRIGRIVEQLRKRGMRAVMLSKIDTIRYATSFRGVYSWQFHGNRHIAIVTDEGHVCLMCGSGDYARVKESMPWLTDVVPFPFIMKEGYELVHNKLKELNIEKGKVGIDMMVYGMVELLREGMPDIQFVDGYPVIEDAQLIKCKEEIDCLKMNAQAVDIGMTTMLDALGEGVTELEVSAAAVHQLMRLGVEDVAYFPLVESGMHSWNTYKFPTEKRIQRGDMIWMDCGVPILNGYTGDIARTAVVGPATSEQKRIYSGIYDMLHYAIEELKPGNSTAKPLEAAEKAAAKHGLSEYIYFGILGHGIGTDLHIAPTIGDKVLKNIDREIDTFAPNMVLALEPGIFYRGVGGGALENMVLITEDGPEVLTKTRFEDHLLVNTGS
ncbi:MAG TPA: Xaa-Pro peptidase family protein [Anaerovoracaceae bacterium]|nr:Xaa-Pro peptidase family protein [Anaerovoracaceae bacterium]